MVRNDGTVRGFFFWGGAHYGTKLPYGTVFMCEKYGSNNTV